MVFRRSAVVISGWYCGFALSVLTCVNISLDSKHILCPRSKAKATYPHDRSS